MQDKQDHVPTVDGKATITDKACMTRHTSKNRIPHYEGKKSRGGRLEETPKGTQLPRHNNTQSETSPKREQPECFPLVRGRVIQDTPRP